MLHVDYECLFHSSWTFIFNYLNTKGHWILEKCFSYRLYDVHWCPDYPNGPAETQLQVLEMKEKTLIWFTHNSLI